MICYSFRSFCYLKAFLIIMLTIKQECFVKLKGVQNYLQQPAGTSVDWCNLSAEQIIKGPPKSPCRYARRAFVPEPEIKQKTNSKQTIY